MSLNNVIDVLSTALYSCQVYTMKIGEGAFGTVYKGLNFMGTGTTVAVKKLKGICIYTYYVTT